MKMKAFHLCNNKRMNAPHLYIGTSGYSYSYWKGRFYEGLSSAKWLADYSARYNSVELNSTFFRFPQPGQLARMAAATDDTFRFSVKAHRSITHALLTHNTRARITEFVSAVKSGLQHKLACVLFQMPAAYSYSTNRLHEIMGCLGGVEHSVVEFRHESWWRHNVHAQLAAAGISMCSISFPGLPDDNDQVSPVFYKRMHGAPELFTSAYPASALQQLATDISNRHESYVYFNNTATDAGYCDAALLRKMCAGSVAVST